MEDFVDIHYIIQNTARNSIALRIVKESVFFLFLALVTHRATIVPSLLYGLLHNLLHYLLNYWIQWIQTRTPTASDHPSVPTSGTLGDQLPFPCGLMNTCGLRPRPARIKPFWIRPTQIQGEA